MTMRSGILCGGCIVVDVNKTIDRWPPEQEVARVLEETAKCGGPALNMALDLARLGARYPIGIVGVIGDDMHGALIEQTCDAHGIKRDALRRSKTISTSYADVMIVAETGRRTFFYSEGSNAELCVEDFDFADSNAEMFHLGSPGLNRGLDRLGSDGTSGFEMLLRAARKAGLRTNLELVSLPQRQLKQSAAPLLPHLSSIIINDIEAEALTGSQMTLDGATNVNAALRAAQMLLERGVAEFAAIHFPFGAVAAARGGTAAFWPSVNVPPSAIASSNGAGDAFAAGFMFGMLETWSLEQSLALGHAAAAASLRSASTFEGIESWQNCQKLAALWGWRTR